MATIYNLLKDCRFAGMKGLDVYEAFRLPRELTDDPELGFKNELYELYRKIFFTPTQSYRFHKGGGKVLFLYSHAFFRQDSLLKFIRLCDTLPDADRLHADGFVDARKKAPDLRLLFLCAVWFLQLLPRRGGIRQKLYGVNRVAEMYLFLRRLKEARLSRYRQLTVYYDMTPHEHLAVQYAKRCGLSTATLQHGVYGSLFGARTLFETLNDYTDTYLVWNDFTKQQLEQTGISADRICVAGIPLYAAEQNPLAQKTDTKHLCVFLDGNYSLPDHPDIAMQRSQAVIDMAHRFCARNGWKYYLKPHPDSYEWQVALVQNDSLCAGVLGREHMPADIAAMVDFSLVINSSVFVEMVQLNQHAFHYKDGCHTIFGSLPVCGVECEQDLQAKWDTIQAGGRESAQLHDLLAVDDGAARYRAFYQNWM